LDEARIVLEGLPESVDASLRAKWRAALAPAEVLGTSPASGGTEEVFRWLAEESEPYRGLCVFLEDGRVVDSDRDVGALRRRHTRAERQRWTLVYVEEPAL